jgi:ribosomal protein S18 acetylase RimI-like enzyme
MVPPMPTRPATPSDIPALLPMVRALCALHQSWDPDRYDFLPDIIARYEHWLPLRAADPRSVFLVAEASDRGPLAGFLIATIEPSIPIYRTTEYAFIHDLWIEPAYRHRGLARALVEDALTRFRALGVTQVRLETAYTNDEARRLFQAADFRVSTIDMLRTL